MFTFNFVFSPQDFRNLRFAHKQENHSRREIFEKIQQYAFPITNKMVSFVNIAMDGRVVYLIVFLK